MSARSAASRVRFSIIPDAAVTNSTDAGPGAGAGWGGEGGAASAQARVQADHQQDSHGAARRFHTLPTASKYGQGLVQSSNALGVRTPGKGHGHGRRRPDVRALIPRDGSVGSARSWRGGTGTGDEGGAYADAPRVVSDGHGQAQAEVRAQLHSERSPLLPSGSDSATSHPAQQANHATLRPVLHRTPSHTYTSLRAFDPTLSPGRRPDSLILPNHSHVHAHAHAQGHVQIQQSPSPTTYDHLTDLAWSAALHRERERSASRARRSSAWNRLWTGVRAWAGTTGVSADFAWPRKRRRKSKGESSGVGAGAGGQSGVYGALGDGRSGIHGDGYDDADEEDVESDEGEDGWWDEQVPPDGMVLPLLIVTFSCALADAGTLIHFNTFATSMTGNTVLVAVAAMGATGKSPLYAAVSLLGFIGTGLVTGQLGAVFGNRKRSWLVSTMLFQIILVTIALLLISPYGPLEVGRDRDWIYVLCIGIQGGAQVTMAANAGSRELPTAMMTTPYAAFVSDPTLFRTGAAHDVRARNRRLIYIATFWIGSFGGAAIARWSSLTVMTGVVLLCKAAVLIMLAFTRGEVDGDDVGGSLGGRGGGRGGAGGGGREEWEREERLRRRRHARSASGGSSVFRRLSVQESRNEADVAM